MKLFTRLFWLLCLCGAVSIFWIGVFAVFQWIDDYDEPVFAIVKPEVCECETNTLVLDGVVDANTEMRANFDELAKAMYELHKRLLKLERGY